MDKSKVAEILVEIGLLLELKGENPFKTRAYSNAARAIENLAESLDKLIAAETLTEVKGIGEAIGKKVKELVETGKLAYYEELKASIPAGLAEMLEIPGVGPKKIKVLHDKLGVQNVAQLEAAILNLAMNARDAMNGSGRITLAAYAAKPHASMTLVPGDYIVITVQDTGTGMDEATIAQACEPFFTTKGLDGSGLGLSMVQGFARQSGGDLHIESSLGRGTRVEVWLPPAGQSEFAPVSEPEPSVVAGRILLVDDEADVLVTVGAFLRKAGYVVTKVTNGEDAVAKLLTGERFDLMITDYAMPGANGFDILQRAHEIDVTMPGLIISGYYVAGARDLHDEAMILRKPFGRAELIERVDALLATTRARPDAVGPGAR